MRKLIITESQMSFLIERMVEGDLDLNEQGQTYQPYIIAQTQQQALLNNPEEFKKFIDSARLNIVYDPKTGQVQKPSGKFNRALSQIEEKIESAFAKNNWASLKSKNPKFFLLCVAKFAIDSPRLQNAEKINIVNKQTVDAPIVEPVKKEGEIIQKPVTEISMNDSDQALGFFEDNEAILTGEFKSYIDNNFIGAIRSGMESLENPALEILDLQIQSACSTLPNGVTMNTPGYTGRTLSFVELATARAEAALAYVLQGLSTLGVQLDKTSKNADGNTVIKIDATGSYPENPNAPEGTFLPDGMLPYTQAVAQLKKEKGSSLTKADISELKGQYDLHRRVNVICTFNITSESASEPEQIPPVEIPAAAQPRTNNEYTLATYIKSKPRVPGKTTQPPTPTNAQLKQKTGNCHARLSGWKRAKQQFKASFAPNSGNAASGAIRRQQRSGGLR